MIKQLLEEEHSKKQTMKIVRYVGFDQKKFDELISYCFEKDENLAQRASWPVSYCIELFPGLIYSHYKKIIRQLKKPGHNAIRRNFTRMMEHVYIPEKYEGEIISICFDLLNATDEFVAIKVYSMIVLEKFCLKYPEVSSELKATIVAQLPFEKAGFRSRANKVLKKIC